MVCVCVCVWGGAQYMRLQVPTRGRGRSRRGEGVAASSITKGRATRHSSHESLEWGHRHIGSRRRSKTEILLLLPTRGGGRSRWVKGAADFYHGQRHNFRAMKVWSELGEGHLGSRRSSKKKILLLATRGGATTFFPKRDWPAAAT